MRNPVTPQAEPEYAQTERPPYVQALNRPVALCTAVELAFLVFDKQNLDRAENFWTDFGLSTVAKDGDGLIMRCAASAPAVIVARRAARSRFVGAAFLAADGTDFERLKHESNAQDLPAGLIPGGGEGVRLFDPDGHEVWLLRRWTRVAPQPVRAPVTKHMNALGDIQRVNTTVRTPVEPAQIGRLGHMVLQTTDFPTMAQWYMRHLGLIPSDVQYLPDGSPLLTFFRLDLGQQPADHHTVVIAGGIDNQFEHCAWEVADLDALGQGQQFMRSRGHRHMWGIGRHVLGSQLFDYWYDDDGFQFEHYTDGDVFTADRETHYVPFSPGSIWAWGDDAPATMLPKKSLSVLWKTLRLIRQGRTSLKRMLMIGRVVDMPARPWL